MLLRFSLGAVCVVCFAVSASAQPLTGNKAPARQEAGAMAEWPATGGKPGQKREYRDPSGAKIIEYYDSRGVKRVIRDRGLND